VRGLPNIPKWAVPWIVVGVESAIGAALVRDLPIWKGAIIIALLIIGFAAWAIHEDRKHRGR